MLPCYSLTVEQPAVTPRSPPPDGPDEMQSYHGSVLQEGGCDCGSCQLLAVQAVRFRAEMAQTKVC